MVHAGVESRSDAAERAATAAAQAKPKGRSGTAKRPRGKSVPPPAQALAVPQVPLTLAQVHSGRHRQLTCF